MCVRVNENNLTSTVRMQNDFGNQSTFLIYFFLLIHCTCKQKETYHFLCEICKFFYPTYCQNYYNLHQSHHTVLQLRDYTLYYCYLYFDQQVFHILNLQNTKSFYFSLFVPPPLLNKKDKPFPLEAMGDLGIPHSLLVGHVHG